MYKSINSPGAIVMVSMGLYNHYAIVSDRWHMGRPMLISLSARTGTVKEEPWHECAANRKVILSDLQGLSSPVKVLSKARSMVGELKYSLFGNNCEHFARWTHDLQVESKQIHTFVMVATGLAFLFTLTRR